MATITSITMTRELVESILADYLSREIFRSPVSVTGSEYIEESVILTLAECEPIVTTTDPITRTYSERFVTATAPQSNGNAHHADGDADLVGADLRVRPAPAPEETTAPQRQASPGGDAPVARKSRHTVTPEEDAEILRLHAEGYPLDRIAFDLGLKTSTVAYRIKRHAEWKAQHAANGAA